VVKRLRQMYEAGGWVLVESTLADLPADLRWLLESGAVTIDQLASAHHALGITSAADIAAAIQEHTLRHVPGLGVEAEAAIAQALPALRAHVRRVPLGRATAVAAPLLETLRSSADVEWVEPAGSLRRGEDLVGDVELIVSASNPPPLIDRVLSTPDVTRSLYRSARRVYFLVERVQVAVRFPERDRAGAELLYLTGSAAHFARLQQFASVQGARLTRAGLSTPEGALLSARTEHDIYSALGLPAIPPEIRAGDEELVAAARGTLPSLVTRTDIRGDLHMHSTWSDGRDSIETMVAAALALGYEYVAITDHSQSSADGVKRQAAEIAAVRERYPDIVILHGCEVDILPDGRLDFPDRILEEFDIVLASLHERAGHGPDQLLKRYRSAMRHPLVSLITHPANRLVPHRAPYELDYDRLFELAAETRTLLEIDGAPGHLDLDGAHARRAVAAGAMLAIDSDCHRADLLERQMQLGIVMARRGWVEPRHVLNTRPIAEVRDAVARKRAGR
jgi:DNA polymerase (family 10)